MKLTIFIFLSTLFIFTQCSDDHSLTYDYHAHIEQPIVKSYSLGDSLPIQILFESHTGETVHHINVRIYNKATGVEVYSKPDDEHVDDSSGEHEFKDTLILNAANGFSANSSWVLVAKVWGHEDGIEEEESQFEFAIQ